MHNSQFFYFNPITNGEKLTIPYSFSVPNPTIVNSCNGLMLLQSDHSEKSFYVYNPTTKRSRQISLTDNQGDKYPCLVELALAFDPSKSHHYKIVCIRSTMELDSDIFDKHTYLIEVYDSESHTWKLSLEPYTHPMILIISHGVYWNGSIYWNSCYEMFYFDIAKNEFKTFSLPNYPSVQYQGIMVTVAPYLQESNGLLNDFRLISDGKCESVTVWELQGGDHSEWLMKYHDITSQCPLTCGSFARRLRFIKGSYDTETCSLVSHRSGKISVYSFLEKSCKELVDYTSQPFYQEDAEGYGLVSYEFGESLAVV